jgi:hypothetical protein
MRGTATGGWPDATPRSSAAHKTAATTPRSNPRRRGHQRHLNRPHRPRIPSTRTTAAPRSTARRPLVDPVPSTGAGSRASRGGPPARQPADPPAAGVRARRYTAANVRKRHTRNASTSSPTHRPDALFTRLGCVPNSAGADMPRADDARICHSLIIAGAGCRRRRSWPQSAALLVGWQDRGERAVADAAGHRRVTSAGYRAP